MATKFWATFIGGVCGLLLMAGQASALVSPSTAIVSGINEMSDNNAELLIDKDESGDLSIGDYLEGILNWGTIDNSAGENDLGGADTNELSGVFRIQVLTKTFISIGLDGALDTGDDVFLFTFGPDSSLAFQNNLGVAAGAMVVLIEDTDGDDDFTRTGVSTAADIATASDGTIVWVWGFSGTDTDEQWVALGPQDPGTLGAGASSFAVFNYQLSSLFLGYSFTLEQVSTACIPLGPSLLNPNPCDIQGTDNSLIDINGSGNIVSPTSGPWPIWSNVDATFFVVPEPGTLGMLGLGLLGLGFFARRRRSA